MGCIMNLAFAPNVRLHALAESHFSDVAYDIEEDARLFDAAPDLLDACKQIVWKLSHNWDNGPARIDRRDATVRLAEKAIAKAEGRATR